jgi:hypothetical protein
MLFLTKAAKTGQIYCTRAIDSKDFKIKNLSKFCLRRWWVGKAYGVHYASCVGGGRWDESAKRGHPPNPLQRGNGFVGI